MSHFSSAHAAILRVRSWFLSITFQQISSTSFAIALFLGASLAASAQSKVVTTTALAVSSSSGPVTTVPSGTVITLTATVTPASGTIGAGQVNFCDASATYCTDIHVLGTAQLTSAGTAKVKIRPWLGNHRFKAVFAGTNSYAGSSSNASALAVTGSVTRLASNTTVAETGSWGSYALTATVTEVGNTAAPSGTVSFLDSSNGNAVLGQGSLGAATAGLGWVGKQSSWTSGGISGVVADFNGDGIADIAEDNGEISILLGNGDGSFTLSGTNLTQGYAAGSMVAEGDFNNDGIPDLVVISPYSSAATIYLGKGDGTFTQVATQPNVGTQASGIAVADFNGDGSLDLAITNPIGAQNSAITILLGNGDGTFTAASQSASAGSGAYAIVAGDFNGDGKTDLAVTAQQTYSLTILLGNGDGTFTTAASPQVTSYANAMAVADFNGDGKLDLIVACDNGGLVVVLLGNGDGTFNAAPSFPGSVSGPNAIVVGDFNQDGIADVGFLNSDYTTGGPIEFVGKGDGTFAQVPGLPQMGIYSAFLVGGDFNGDGRTDLATPGSGPGGPNLAVYLTEPTETASATANITVSGVGQHLVDASYLGDGNYIPSSSSTLALWGVQPATFTTLALTAGGNTVTSVLPGTVVTLTATVTSGTTPLRAGQVNFCDASATYCSDIHLLGTGSLSSNGTAALKFVPGPGTHSYKAVLVENGFGLSSSSNLAPLVVGPAPAPVYIDTTAISASGNPGNYTLTATVVGFGGTAAPTGAVSFLDTSFGNITLGTASLGTSTAGVGWLASQTPALSYAPIAEVEGDFNGDGIPDLAQLWTSGQYGSGPYSVTIFFGAGNGTFTTGPTTAVAGVQSHPYMIAGDFNGDGRADLVILSWNNSSISYVTTLLGNADGTFAAPQTNVAFNQGIVGGDGVPGSMIAADFNGDGNLDLAVVGDYVSTGGVSILLGNGDGTFKTGITFASNHDFGLVATGDFNGDGIPDLVVTNYFEFGSGPTIFLGKGDGNFTAKATSFTLDYFPTSIVVGDFNGDGILDLAFSDLNGVEIALGKGDGTFTETSASPITVRSELYSLVAGDFNHDGKLDIAGIDNYNDQIDILVGAGDGTFTEILTTPNVSQTWLGPFAIVAADFNGDGVPDLAMLTKNVDTASILLTEQTKTVSATVNGIAPIGAGTHNVEASYPGDSNYGSSVSSTLALNAGLAPLVISPAGGAYSSAQTVTLTESVPGATIYYLGMGIINTNGFVPYTGPIALAQGGTEFIQAYATETGYQQSDYVIANYTLILPTTATPTISLAAGYYAGPQTVTITDSDTSAKIYYTTNGTNPTTSSNLYSGPITVSSSETLVVRALSYAHSYSLPVSAQYVIGTSSVPLIYSIAGSGMNGYSGDGGPATLAQIHAPSSVVKDASGNIYFSDQLNHMVRKVAAGTSVISLLAGTGSYGYSGDGGPATSAELGYPSCLALDSGSLFIADQANATVRRVDLSSGIITTYAGNGTMTIQGDGGPATAAGIGSISGIAIDASHNLYIAEGYGATVRQVNGASGTISTIAGTGVPGYSGDGGPAISATFRATYGLAFDASGSLYIADSANELIRKITATNGVIGPSSIISTVAGTPASSQYTYPAGGYSGDGGPATSAKLNSPVAVALDSSGNLFISDEYNSAIREVTASNGNISTIAGNGSCSTLGGDGGAAAGASLCYPWGIAVDSVGDLLIVDGVDRIREVVPAAAPPNTQAATPTFSVAAGNYANAQSITISDATPGASVYVTVDGSTPTTGSAGYSLPINVAATVTIKAIATAPGYLNSAVTSATYNISGSAPLITTVAGNGTPGFVASPGPALSTMFWGPKGIAFDKAGNLYVSDTGNHVIWLISKSSGTASLLAGTGTSGHTGDGGPATSATLNSPGGLAFDSAGNLYVADSGNNVVREIAASTGIISTYAGGAMPTYNGSIGDGGPATSANLRSPAAVAFDGANNLYITDTYNYRIREVAANTGIITTVAGNGTQPNSGDGGPATSAGLQPPDCLAVDRNGNIYLASSNGAIVRKVTSSTGIISTIAGLKDLAGQTSDNGPALGAEVYPRALALDAAGNLYISNAPGEIREINASSGIISSIAGIGYPGYSGDGGAAAVAQIYYPAQVAFDAAGNLYFADSMDRIRKVTFNPEAAAPPVFSVPSGTYTTSQNVALTDPTPNATIYYTTDGSTPGISSNLYTTPITVSSSETINAIAIAPAYTPSAVATATYVLNLQAPAPSLTSLSPAFTSAGGAQFTLTINGSGFTGASSAYWATTALTTHLVSSTQLTATVPASDISSAGIAAVTVQTPSPGGGTSNTLKFEIDTAGAATPPSFSTPSATVSAGGTASYPVTLPSSATNVSVGCLNLPTGASCSYSASTSTLTITTTSATPSGTYVITAVFNETLPGAAAALVLLPFLLAPFATKRRNAARVWLLAIIGVITVAAVAAGCGGGGSKGGGGGGGSNPPPATHQATSSGTITLIVK